MRPPHKGGVPSSDYGRAGLFAFGRRYAGTGREPADDGKLLGHTQVLTTAQYAHLARDPVKASASEIADSIGADSQDGEFGRDAA